MTVLVIMESAMGQIPRSTERISSSYIGYNLSIVLPISSWSI